MAEATSPPPEDGGGGGGAGAPVEGGGGGGAASSAALFAPPPLPAMCLRRFSSSAFKCSFTSTYVFVLAPPVSLASCFLRFVSFLRSSMFLSFDLSPPNERIALSSSLCGSPPESSSSSFCLGGRGAGGAAGAGALLYRLFIVISLDKLNYFFYIVPIYFL